MAIDSGDHSWTRFHFRMLCEEYYWYKGDRPVEDVLAPRLGDALAALQVLAPYRRLDASVSRKDVAYLDLHVWYALSRLNDYLLLSFQAAPKFAEERSRHDAGWPDRMAAAGFRPPPAGWVAAVTPTEYREYFSTLGFEEIGGGAYDPFRHEIVEVIVDDGWNGPPQAEHVYWPGWMFGQMLFARAGVRVRCGTRGPEALDKSIAEASALYFTYRRIWRKCEDLSIGSGHNSEWAVGFRRDYDTGDAYHLNVDGGHPLGDEAAYEASFDEDEWADHCTDKRNCGPNALTMAERIELMVNRCYVRCPKDDDDPWPYDDTFTMPKPASGGGASDGTAPAARPPLSSPPPSP